MASSGPQSLGICVVVFFFFFFFFFVGLASVDPSFFLFKNRVQERVSDGGKSCSHHVLISGIRFAPCGGPEKPWVEAMW
jgi:hypothetical protein